MNKALVLVAVVGMSAGFFGCEEKKEGASNPVGGALNKAGDTMKAAGDKVKETADNAKDAAKDAAKNVSDKTADAAKAAADKAKDAADKAKTAAADMGDKAKTAAADASAAIKAEVQNMIDTSKTKIDALSKGGESLSADMKPAFNDALTSIKTSYTELTNSFSKLGTSTGDGMASGWADLKAKGSALMDKIKATAEKYNIKM